MLESIRVDHSPEFISKEVDLWVFTRRVVLDFSRPGKPTDNAFIESFNTLFRQECLNEHWFFAWRVLRKRSKPGGATSISINPTAAWAISSRWSYSRGSAPEPLEFNALGKSGGAGYREAEPIGSAPPSSTRLGVQVAGKLSPILRAGR